MSKKSFGGWDWTLVGAFALLSGGALAWYLKPEWFGLSPPLSPSGEPMPRALPSPLNLFMRVRNRSKANGVHPSLQAALDEWEQSGPFPVVVGSGVRTDAEQRGLFAKYGTAATRATSINQSAHGVRSGYGNALDLDPVPSTRANYVAMGEWFEARGFEWGGRWLNAFPPGKDNPYGGDQRHVNVKDWRSIPI